MGIFDRFKKNKAAKAAAPKVEAKAEDTKVEAPKAETAPAAKPAAKKAPAKAAATKAPAKAAAKKAPAKKAPAKKDYQPQCAALTGGGDQCRNSARSGSKYCGSHKGYQPPSNAKVNAKKDTAPASKKAADTLPGEKADGSAQCAALTASGSQCKRSARDGSKYCASHKGYRHASDASKVKKADTKPRVAGAADTKPSVRKASHCAAKTQAGKPCQRKPAGKSKYCASHKGYRA